VSGQSTCFIRAALAAQQLDRTERLVRSQAFRTLHRRIIAALERIGVGTLAGGALRQVLVVDGEPGRQAGSGSPTQMRP
jgi:hypothetical protein